MSKYIDSEEKEIIESLRNDKWISDFSDDIKNEFEVIALNTIGKTKSIEIQVNDKDYHKFNDIAEKQGLTADALIALLMRK